MTKLSVAKKKYKSRKNIKKYCKISKKKQKGGNNVEEGAAAEGAIYNSPATAVAVAAALEDARYNTPSNAEAAAEEKRKSKLRGELAIKKEEERKARYKSEEEIAAEREIARVKAEAAARDYHKMKLLKLKGLARNRKLHYDHNITHDDMVRLLKDNDETQLYNLVNNLPKESPPTPSVPNNGKGPVEPTYVSNLSQTEANSSRLNNGEGTVEPTYVTIPPPETAENPNPETSVDPKHISPQTQRALDIGSIREANPDLKQYNKKVFDAIDEFFKVQIDYLKTAKKIRDSIKEENGIELNKYLTTLLLSFDNISNLFTGFEGQDSAYSEEEVTYELLSAQLEYLKNLGNYITTIETRKETLIVSVIKQQIAFISLDSPNPNPFMINGESLYSLSIKPSQLVIRYEMLIKEIFERIAGQKIDEVVNEMSVDEVVNEIEKKINEVVDEVKKKKSQEIIEILMVVSKLYLLSKKLALEYNDNYGIAEDKTILEPKYGPINNDMIEIYKLFNRKLENRIKTKGYKSKKNR
jgi:hypothetical protein